jgi:signal transduction histidine kinase
VLDIARIEAGGHALTLEAVTLGPVLDDVRSLISPQAQAAGVDVRIEGETGGVARIDRRATVQILLNLLSNAVKYGPAGGTVNVSVFDEPDRLRVEVVDEGPGVPDALMTRLFTPFDRLDAERWSGAEGSGLGLALSRGLAQAQGGDVVYRPRGDRSGAVFSLDLINAASLTGDTE